MIARFSGGPLHGEVREVESPLVRYVEPVSFPVTGIVTDPAAIVEYDEKTYRGERIALPFDPTPLGFVGVEKQTDLATDREWWTFWTMFTPESRGQADDALDQFNVALNRLLASLGVPTSNQERVPDA